MIGQLPKKPQFAKRKVTRFSDFSSGLNDKVSPMLIKDTEVAAIRNFTFDQKGTLTKRKGYIKRYASVIAAAPIKGLYNFRKEDGTSLLVIGCNGSLYKDNPNFEQTYDSQAEWETSGVQQNATMTSDVAGDVRPGEGTKGSPGRIDAGGEGSDAGGTAVYHESIWRSQSMDITSVADKTTGSVTKSVTLPSGTSATIESRTSPDNVTFGAWTALGVGDTITGVGTDNYLQLRIRFNSTSGARGSAQSVIVRFDTTASATSIGSGFSTSARWRFETQNDTLVAFNGENAPQKWTGSGSTASLGGSPPQGKYVKLHKNRMFVAGVSSQRSRLYYSDLGDPETWPALSFIDVGKGDGDTITGLDIVLDSLVITKSNSVWILNGDASSNFVLRRASSDGGSVGMYSSGTIKNTVAWLGKDGIRVFDGLRSALASEKIEATFNGLNERQLALAAGIVHDSKYYVAVPNGSAQLSNNLVLVFDTLRTAWTVFDGMAASEFCVFRQFQKDTLLFGSATTGQVYEMSDTLYTDDGSAITAYVTTKASALAGGPEAQSLARTVYVSCAEPSSLSTSASVSFYKDLGTETAAQTISLAAQGLNIERAIPSAASAAIVRTLAVKVSHAESGKGFNLHSIAIEHLPKSNLRVT